MKILRILVICGIFFYLVPGLVMLLFYIALFVSFLYFISRLMTVLNTPSTKETNNYQQTKTQQGVTVECEEYRVKKS